MHIDPYVLYISICICICVIFILFNWFHYLCPRRTCSLALYFGKQYCTKMLHCYLRPLLTVIYCEIEIRAHKPRLPALIAMKECYQFFSKQCTLYLLPEHVKMLHWLHVCFLYTEWKLCNFMAIKSFHCHCHCHIYIYMITMNICLQNQEKTFSILSYLRPTYPE